MGALSIYDPKVKLSKRALSVPTKIQHLAPIDYEFKINFIHEYASMDLD